MFRHLSDLMNIIIWYTHLYFFDIVKTLFFHKIPQVGMVLPTPLLEDCSIVFISSSSADSLLFSFFASFCSSQCKTYTVFFIMSPAVYHFWHDVILALSQQIYLHLNSCTIGYGLVNCGQIHIV